AITVPHCWLPILSALSVLAVLALRRLQHHLDAGERLSDLVMQLACDAPPLGFLHLQHLAREPLQRAISGVEVVRALADAQLQLITRLAHRRLGAGTLNRGPRALGDLAQQEMLLARPYTRRDAVDEHRRREASTLHQGNRIDGAMPILAEILAHRRIGEARIR